MTTPAVEDRMKRFVSTVCLSVVLPLLAAAGPEAQPLKPKDESLFTIEKVYVKVETGKRSFFRIGRRLGDLKVDPDRLRFVGNKGEIVLPFEDIELLYDGKMPGDVDTDWAIFRLRDGATAQVWAVRDGRAAGFGQRTPEILAQLMDFMKENGHAQFRVTDDWKPFNRVDRRFTLGVPSAWEVKVDEETTRGEVVHGAHFRFRPKGDTAPVEFLVELDDAFPGFGCSRITKRARRTFIEAMAERRGVAPEAMTAARAKLSHCDAVELSWNDGDHEHRLRAAANGEVIYLLELVVDPGVTPEPSFEAWSETAVLARLP